MRTSWEIRLYFWPFFGAVLFLRRDFWTSWDRLISCREGVNVKSWRWNIPKNAITYVVCKVVQGNTNQTSVYRFILCYPKYDLVGQHPTLHEFKKTSSFYIVKLCVMVYNTTTKHTILYNSIRSLRACSIFKLSTYYLHTLGCY